MKRFLFFLILSLILPVAGALAASAAPAPQRYIPSLIRISDDAAITALEEDGAKVWHRRGDIIIAFLPDDPATATGAMTGCQYNGSVPSAIRRARRLPGVEQIERSRRLSPSLDTARSHFAAEDVLIGKGFPQPYTGKGVVVGLVDIGFDPLHVNFLADDGTPRVRRFVTINDTLALKNVMTTREEFEAVRTDDPDEWHATHVAGIMAGGYKDNGFNGIASDAEIVACTSLLYDAGILAGIEEIVGYARSQGKRCVVNLSLAGYIGPHDGTSLCDQYLAMLGEEAFICLATGNAGDTYNALSQTFTEQHPTTRVRIHCSDWMQFDMTGATDIWSVDSTPLRARILVYDEYTREVVYASSEQDASVDFLYRIESGSDPEFARYYDGWIELEGWERDRENGRCHLLLQYDAHTGIRVPGKQWARYNIALEVTGPAGSGVQMFADGQSSRFVGFPGWPGPHAALSVSDMAAADRVIAVGMYNSRARLPVIDGSFREASFAPMTVSKYTGFGTFVNGRTVPHTVAPGGAIVSSTSGPFVEAHPEAVASMCARSEVDGTTCYWDSNSGTSMSTPYVAGFLATWLEADPMLEYDDVMRIILATNRHDYPDPENPRHGQGWFDPRAGLQAVVEQAGLTGLWPSANNGPRLEYRDGSLTIWNPARQECRLDLYTPAGLILATYTTTAPAADFPIPAIVSGLMIAALTTPDTIQTMKIGIKSK